MDNNEREKVGKFWLGDRFSWQTASAEERAYVEGKLHEQAAAPADSPSPAKALACTIVDAVRGFVARSLATRDAKIRALEDRVAALEGGGEKAGKPRIRLRSVANDK